LIVLLASFECALSLPAASSVVTTKNQVPAGRDSVHCVVDAWLIAADWL
jgi:hypothetical protein